MLSQPSPTPLHQGPLPMRKAPLFTPYVVVWTMFGVLSVGLLGVIGLAPEWLDDLRPAASFADPQSNQGQRAAARVAADLNALKDSVSKVQLDLAKVATDVAQQSEQQKVIGAQLSALEARVQPQTPVATEASIVPKYVAPGTAAVTAAAPPPTPAAPAAGEPARTPKVINADATAAPVGLETGSVAPAKVASEPISFGPAVVKPAPQPFGIKLSSGASQDSLRLSWSLLAEKYGDSLKGLEPRYTAGGDAANPNYDLIAGPLKSKAEAARACKTLAAKGVPCIVGAFAGEAL